MAELHDLSPTPGSRKNRKRVGRGPGSGHGKTSTRGEKGQKARSGGKVRPGFEGGQMALIRRIPKRGFRSRNRVEYQVVNVRDLERFEGDVSPESLAAAGLVRRGAALVKILGEGDLSRKLSVSAHAFSAGARSKIEAAGGSVLVLGGEEPGGRAAAGKSEAAASGKKRPAAGAGGEPATESQEESPEA